MSGNFRISSPDGSEFFVSEMATLQRLYRNGSIDANTWIQTPDSKESRPLREVFNLLEWNPVPQTNVFTNAATNNIASAPPTPEKWAHLRYDNVETVEEFEKSTTRGVRPFGILLIINSLVTGALLIFLKFSAKTEVAEYLLVILFIDLLVGIVLAGSKWKPLALLRAFLGGLIFGLVMPLYLLTPLALIEGGLQLIIAVGLFVMVSGRRATVLRVIMGISITCIAWFGVKGLSAINYVLPQLKLMAIEKKFEQDTAPYALATRTFNDPEAGISVDMPDGWAMLKPDNPYTQVQNAKMIIVNPKAACFAGLVVQTIPPNTNINSIDDYHEALLRNRTGEGQEFTKLSRTNTKFGSLLQTEIPQRLELSWTHSGLQIHGWRSVCRIGNTYYTLTEWGPEEAKDLGFDAFVKLESVFQITGPKPSHK